MQMFFFDQYFESSFLIREYEFANCCFHALYSSEEYRFATEVSLKNRESNGGDSREESQSEGIHVESSSRSACFFSFGRRKQEFVLFNGLGSVYTEKKR